MHPLQELYVYIQSSVYQIDVIDLIKNAPSYYLEWWLALYKQSPQHVIVETALATFIIWLLFIRQTVDPSKMSENKLSSKEMDWLLKTWTPKSLVPGNNELSENAKINIEQGVGVTITAFEGNYIKISNKSL